MDEFAEILRAWRDRVRPEDVGLAPGPNRRTPGLRREELAHIAGVSVDYVVRLEQGRARHPSPQLLTSLARALRLTDAERDHLFRVAGAAVPSAGHVPRHVTPTAQRMVDRFRNAPVAVAVHTAIYELVLWNPLWAALFGDPSTQSRLERNVAWRYFQGSIPVTHTLEDDEAYACDLVGHLRAATGRYPDDPELPQLIERLLEASPDFARRWRAGTVGELRTSRKTLHTAVGDIVVDCDTFTGGPGDQTIVVMTAAPGSEDEQKLDLLRVIGLQQLQS
ncbi:helix-turn-helix transcriptional regulator [Actinomycetospora straminea]|uniref:helix-turn-helix transcriptional regulator n=1 Tax=Actinomycetospora straminea TaxID=663607 RepID=UPI002366F90E|nr:helix-turn-helix transcriptional regulator [Actinomycetospora straminea]MDD7933859.1 helix-turn-helix transcriptional regulator [Actinomycetospora straminea]